ncbi:MAG: methyltransferase domain-containing protein [Anaerolineales bacterium]|nr:methyltransferase domain-containing protein [Anaerolineales bacterium]
MSSTTTQIEQCPVCYKQTFVPFFELNNVPAQDGVLWNNLEEALTAPTGNIKLAFCQSCGYIGNLLFEPKKIRYDQEYSFSLHFSPTYQNFINDLASRLVEKYGLKNKRILEIGCGQGDFLRLICSLGHNRGIGIDPSTTSHVEQIGLHEITFLQDFYSEKYARQEVDLVCCRQVLDQLPHPKIFIELLRQNIGQHAPTTVYFEVPNAVKIFEDLLIRNIIYEKSSWFTPTSISRLFELSGFKILSVEPCFEGGQYLGIEAVPTSGVVPDQITDDADLEYFGQLIRAFSENYRRKIKTWGEQLSALRHSGQRAIVWGAGSGAINFFSMLKIKEEISYVVDINPQRQGKFLPLTGQQVVPPEFIQEYKADVIIITNSTYEQEIRQQVADMGMDCRFWVI